MKDRPSTIWIAAFALCVSVALIGGVWSNIDRPALKTASVPRKIDATTLAPGGSLELSLGGRGVVVSVPPREGYIFGTFEIAIASLGFASGPIERDGSLEAVWIADVNGDTKEDAVFVVRNGGSGSYVDIVVLESGSGRFTTHRLPSISSAAIPGYLGHDAVSIRDGLIVRSFPTYKNQKQVRIDRQWKLEDGLKGEVPIRVKPDSNSDPTGATVELQFNFIAGRWIKL